MRRNIRRPLGKSFVGGKYRRGEPPKNRGSNRKVRAESTAGNRNRGKLSPASRVNNTAVQKGPVQKRSRVATGIGMNRKRPTGNVGHPRVKTKVRRNNHNHRNGGQCRGCK